MRRIFALALSVLLVLQALPGHAQTDAASDLRAVALLPGDLIRIEIWREEDLSGEFPVAENGMVVLPLLGEQRVTGIPLTALRDGLLEKYRVQLRNPSITITPLRRINILGEVQKPGLYPIDPTVTLAGAVALAGGTTSAGDMSRIRIVRSGEMIRQRVGVAETLTAANIRSGDQIIVEERNWFSRNSTFVVSTLLSVTSIVIALVQ